MLKEIICGKKELNSEERVALHSPRSQLDEINMEKPKGGFVLGFILEPNGLRMEKKYVF